MKLIKKGKPKTVYAATCRHCDAVWEADIGELKTGFCRNEFYICTETCGECGQYGLDFEEIPCIDDVIV